MGRLTVAAAGGADSSPSSAESSFRELDDVFLQTQTRIWLGEVLKTRLDENIHISDLLQDGEILFEVSKVVWNLLLNKCMELRHLKHKYGPFGSRMSSGRYKPYSNVDSFLKMCKILGLSGIDLFSPSDVVEKREIRKVCICIRALSKKARSKQLSVPDFDLVIYSVAMPTDMVGGIRRSLELSQCTVSSSSSYSPHKGSRMRPKKIKPYTSSGVDGESDSENSDEADSRYMGENSFSPKNDCEAADVLCSNLKNPSDPISYVNDEANHRCGNGVVEVSDTDYCLENDGSVVGENNYISDYLAFSDLMVHATDGNSSVIPDGGSNMFDFFLHADSRGLTSDKGSIYDGTKKKYSDDEDMEVSSTTSMSSVLGRVLNLEFELDESPMPNVWSSESLETETEKHCKNSIVLPKIQNTEIMSESQSSTELFDSREVESVAKLNVSAQYSSSYQNKLHVSSIDSEKNSCSRKSVEDSEESTNQEPENVDAEGVCGNESSILFVSYESDSDNYSSLANPSGLHAEDMNRDKKANDVRDSEEKGIQGFHILNASLDGKKDSRPKHVRRPLLKTVVKGTAIAGILFLLLHIGKKRSNDGQEIKQSNVVSNSKYSKSIFTLKKQQKESRGKGGVYPSRKLKLRN